MKSIFSEKDNSEFITRIEKLTPASPALWGKMNVSQMLAHCSVLIKMTLGDLNSKRQLIGLLFGKLAKKNVFKDEPFKKNLPTVTVALIKDQKQFEEEKAALIAALKQLQKAGPTRLGNDPHPFFGYLTPEEWDHLNAKHLDHHLAQFGV